MVNTKGRLMLNVLIIDDDKISCKDIEASLRQIYNRDEINIYSALNYEQAQKIIYSHRIDIDILFIDIVLNSDDIVSNGLDIIEEILMSRKNLPFIVISGFYFEKIRETNRKLLGLEQYVGFLDKSDYNEDDILDVINKALSFLDNNRTRSINNQNNETRLLKSPETMPFKKFLSYLARDCEFHDKAVSDLEIIYKQDKKLYHSVLDFIGNYDRNPKSFVSEKFKCANNKVIEIKNEVLSRAIRMFVLPRSPKKMICRICDHPSSYTPMKNWVKQNC